MRCFGCQAATGVHFRALACPSLMDNMLRQGALIRDQGVFYWLAPGDFKAPQVATAPSPPSPQVFCATDRGAARRMCRYSAPRISRAAIKPGAGLC